MVFAGCCGEVWDVSVCVGSLTVMLMFWFCSSESLLRRALFEETGGMYPELITRPDIKVFLPPIGNLTVYICPSISFLFLRVYLSFFLVGNPAFISDETKELTLRVHDECT